MTAFSDGERTDPVGGKVVRRVGAGVLYRNDRFAHLYWQNLLAVDPANELSAEALIAEADRLFAGLAIRHLLVADARSAEPPAAWIPGCRLQGGGARDHAVANGHPIDGPRPPSWSSCPPLSFVPRSRPTRKAARATTTPCARCAG
jgi:hypothetical protein